MGIAAWFQESVLGNTLMIVFLVAVIGYLVGSIKIRGVELGTAGVLLVALVFGHFGFKVPDLVRELGLICFVTSVGFIAGPKFFRNFKINARSYILLGAIIIIIGALTTIGIIEIAGVPSDVSVGMMAGALTSTPGLAAAIDATGSAHASVGVRHRLSLWRGGRGAVCAAGAQVSEDRHGGGAGPVRGGPECGGRGVP